MIVLTETSGLLNNTDGYSLFDMTKYILGDLPFGFDWVYVILAVLFLIVIVGAIFHSIFRMLP